MGSGIFFCELNQKLTLMNYYELKPEDNHFYSIGVDITHKCNMRCGNCYIPNRTIPDMDKLKLFALLLKLPEKCEIRLIGAEPTMREDLPEIISKIRELNHRPVLITNGLKLSRLDYVKLLKKAGLFIVNISLNGGLNDEIYRKMDGGAFSKRKIKALRNLIDTGFFVNTNTILMKGVNENVPMEIFKILKALKVKRAVMRFRNVGQLGRYMVSPSENYSYRGLIQFIAGLFQLNERHILAGNKIDGYEEKNTVLFPVEKNRHSSIYIKITDWSPETADFPDPGSKRRGRVTQNFTIAPFWEHVKANELVGY